MPSSKRSRTFTRSVSAGSLTSSKRQLLRCLDRLKDRMLDVSRELYLRPELSGQEQHACALLCGILEEAGFEVEQGVGGLETAFIARLSRGRGSNVGILLEYDALPGIGHGCGHNLIAASGLAAGLALANVNRSWRGTLTLFGTPAEETFGGKAVLSDAGVFDGLDGALIVHGGHENRVFTESLACGSFEVVFTGRAAHAVVCPEKGVNALDALVQLYVGLSLAKKSLGQGVKVVGVILEGGERANLVPARAVGHFSVRAPNHAQRRAAHRRVVRLVESVSRASGTRFSLRPTDAPYMEMRTNHALALLARDNFDLIGRRTNDAPRASMGSIDMGNVSQRVPSVHLYVDLGAGSVPAHTRQFARATQAPNGRRATLAGAQVLALTALDLFCGKVARRGIRTEFLKMKKHARLEGGGKRRLHGLSRTGKEIG
ncbi:MAG: amidohydrolase [Acidobacteriota bacterium]